jgi:hypothetical protein
LQCICCSEGGQEVRARLPSQRVWQTCPCHQPPVLNRCAVVSQRGLHAHHPFVRAGWLPFPLLRGDPSADERDTRCGDGAHGGRAACHRVAVAALPHARRPPLPTRSPSLSGGRQQQRVDPPTTHGGTHGIGTPSGMHSPSFPPEVRRVDQLYCHSRSAPRWHGTNTSRD